MMDGKVRIEHAGRVARITLDRPRAKNALTSSMLSTLGAAVDALAADERTEVVVLSGSGTDFCAGSDLGDIAAVLDADPAERRAAFVQGMRAVIHPLVRTLHELRQPVVTAVRGHAIGIGAALVLASDLVVASETTRVTLPQVRLGHTLDHGESYLLPRRVGPAKALQLCLLGERMSGHDAERFGLVNWVSPDSELEARTDAVVDGLLTVAPIPLARTKALLRRSADTTFTEQLEAEIESASSCAATGDFVEAVSAQVERRVPAFVGA